jgi:hypothetical protein
LTTRRQESKAMHTDPVTQNHGNSPQRAHRHSGSWFSRGIVVTLVLLSGAVLAPRAVSGPITYEIQDYAALQDGHALSGSITTDGFIGPLNQPLVSHILSWTVTIDTTTFSSQDAGAFTGYSPNGASITATLTTIKTNGGGLFLSVTQNDLSSEIAWNDYKGANTYLGLINNVSLWSIPLEPPPAVPGIIAVAIPEPSSAVLAVFGAVAFIAHARARQRRAKRRQTDAGHTQPTE